ncbi:AN1-type zinc finger protein 2A [Tetranychus urticae]|uniref:AN1-type domain-containing protein n=1 Tax=Tetranychus urticae TaxID=32264 RepID=T1KI43_TETUR|nr:AN1-type zinc finger protein 2A [Tetranychus urticae]XP_015791849.1 AN1-type zinc finger protein 2A [Tetranychus urticae]
MEFPDLGKHCSDLSCKQLDFLPVVCDACNKVFCLNHYKYEDHSCAHSHQRDNQVPVCPLCNKPVPLRKGESPDLRVNQHIEDECQDGRALKKRSTIYKNRCTFERCKQKELVPITCDICRNNFCLKHRHPLDHKCASKKGNTDTRNGNRNGWSLSKAGEAALRRMTSSNSNSNRSSNNSRRDNTVNQGSSSKIKSVQGNLTEDEALAWALQQSLNEQTSKASVSTPDDQLFSSTGDRSQRDVRGINKDKCSLA